MSDQQPEPINPEDPDASESTEDRDIVAGDEVGVSEEVAGRDIQVEDTIGGGEAAG